MSRPLYVLDTDVYISALRSPNGGSDVLVQQWRAGEFDVATSPELIKELSEVSQRPEHQNRINPGERDQLLTDLHSKAIEFDDVKNPPRVSPDRNDDYLFQLAQTSQADALVSHNRRDVVDVKLPNLATMTPGDVLQQQQREPQKNISDAGAHGASATPTRTWDNPPTPDKPIDKGPSK